MYEDQLWIVEVLVSSTGSHRRNETNRIDLKLTSSMFIFLDFRNVIDFCATSKKCNCTAVEKCDYYCGVELKVLPHQF